MEYVIEMLINNFVSVLVMPGSTSSCRFEEPRPLNSMRDFTRVGSACPEAKKTELGNATTILEKTLVGGEGVFSLTYDANATIDDRRGLVVEDYAYRELGREGFKPVSYSRRKWSESIMYGEPDTFKGLNRILNQECRVVDRNHVETNVTIHPRGRKEAVTVKKTLYDEELLKCRHMDINYWALRVFVNKYDSTGRLVGGSISIYISSRERPRFVKELSRDIEYIRSKRAEVLGTKVTQ